MAISVAAHQTATITPMRVAPVMWTEEGDAQPGRGIVPIVVDEVNGSNASLLGPCLEIGRWQTDAHRGFHVLNNLPAAGRAYTTLDPATC